MGARHGAEPPLLGARPGCAEQSLRSMERSLRSLVRGQDAQSGASAPWCAAGFCQAEPPLLGARPGCAERSLRSMERTFCSGAGGTPALHRDAGGLAEEPRPCSFSSGVRSTNDMPRRLLAVVLLLVTLAWTGRAAAG